MHVLNKYRGWVSDTDPSNNSSYYLYISDKYCLISSRSFYKKGADVIYINIDGTIASDWVDYTSGGVRLVVSQTASIVYTSRYCRVTNPNFIAL